MNRYISTLSLDRVLGPCVSLVPSSGTLSLMGFSPSQLEKKEKKKKDIYY